MMSPQIESINFKRKDRSKEKNEIPELKSVSEIKNLLEGLNNRFERAEERSSKFKDKSTEMIECREQKEKRMKTSDQSLRDCGIPSSLPIYA